jgi:hypothetical protein
VEVQVSVDPWPTVTVAGAKEALHVEGWAPTETVAEHVAVLPVPLSTLSVHVCVAFGVTEAEPVGKLNMPLPRLPVQVYASLPSASFAEVHDKVDDSLTLILAGLKEALHVGNAEEAEPHKVTGVRVPGALPVFEETVKLPLKLPVLGGVKATVTLQVAPGVMVRSGMQVEEAILKGLVAALTAGEPKVRSPEPPFPIKTVPVATLPTVLIPKSRGLGTTVSNGKAEEAPVRLTATEEAFVAFEETLKMPLKLPGLVGVNCNVIVHI